MTERDAYATFELRLAEALRRYVADAPTEVEPYELVDTLASRQPLVRATGWPWASGLSPAVAWLLLVAALVVALAAAVAVGASLLPLRELTVIPAPSGEPSVAPTVAPTAASSTPTQSPPGPSTPTPADSGPPSSLEGMPTKTWSMTDPELGTAAWIFDIAQRAGVRARSYTVAYSGTPARAWGSEPRASEGPATNYYGAEDTTEQPQTRIHTLTFDPANPGTIVAAFEASYHAEFKDSFASTTCTSRQLAGRSVLWCAFNGWGPWFNWYAWEDNSEGASVLYLVEGLEGIGENSGSITSATEMLLAILKSLP